MRKYFLDNIRWATVLLVLIYHVFYLFNHVGVFGAVSKQTEPKIFDVFLYFVYPWIMVLLFLVAGISARYSSQKRSARQFLNSRITKLLVPSTLGLFVYQWISGYLYIKIGGTMDTIPLFLRYPIFALSGTGPLWFIQTLFLFSLLIVLIRKLDPGDKLWNFCKKINIFIIILFVFPIWGASQVLNVPVITVYRFGIYGLTFLAGYFIFSHDKVLDTVEKIHIPAAIAAIILGVFYVIYYFGQDYTSAQCLKSFFTNVYLWIAVLAILGCAKSWFDKTSRFAEYMTGSSFGFYIIHYPVVLVICYLLSYSFNFTVTANYIIAIIVELIFTAIVFEIFRKIPVIRYLVLGIKKES
jgi:glucans biosynthesis protein C